MELSKENLTKGGFEINRENGIQGGNIMVEAVFYNYDTGEEETHCFEDLSEVTEFLLNNNVRLIHYIIYLKQLRYIRL